MRGLLARNPLRPAHARPPREGKGEVVSSSRSLQRLPRDAGAHGAGRSLEVEAMTKKKGLKRLVRERQAKTGERYSTALVHVRGKEKSPIPFEECHDASSWAAREGLHCRAVVSEKLWQAEEAAGAPDDRFHLIFGKLRAILVASRSDPSFGDVCAALLEGKKTRVAVPNAVREVADSRRFLEQTRAGVRGFSSSGRMIAFDAPRGEEPVTLIGVLIFAPPSPESRPPLLWLSPLEEREQAGQGGLREEIEKHLLLAGLGGLADEVGR